jgi:peptide subunit release factor 1 (eRF1)
MPQLDQISAQLDNLAYEAGPFPVISLYLNLGPDEHGRGRFDTFLRKEFSDRVRTYAASGPERESLDQDVEKIRRYVETVDASLKSAAIFASSGAQLFETIELAAPIEAHLLYISDVPHLYPLARTLDQFPRYLALLADTHSARIFVFAANSVEKRNEIENEKTKHHKKGGWSQARYQRHVENYHVHHAKEVVDAVARIAREERIDKILLSGDEVIVPLLRDQMPKEIAERIVDMVKLDTHAPEHEVLESTIAALRESDAETDRDRVDALLDAYRAGGLGVAGVEETLKALELGQVDELLIAARPEAIKPRGAAAADDRSEALTPAERAADTLVTKARETAAKIRFIEDPQLMNGVGGAGAFLRFKL